MRVLIVLRYFYCPSMPIGGAERQALKLARRLIERGIAITMVAGQWEWGQPGREEIGGVPVHRHFTGWGMFDIKGLRKFGQYLYLLTLFWYLVRHRNEYDLIHCHSAMFGASVVVLAGQLLRKKTLVRGMASGAWGDIRRMREDRSILGTGWMLSKLKEADCIVALNRQVFQELVEIGVRSEQIVHIPNGVELGQAGGRTSYGLGRGVALIFVGRLHPQKGVNTLLMAFKRVQEERPQLSWCLRLVGEGELRCHLEAMAHQLSIDQQVEFLGHVDDPLPLLDQSDIFILPSRSEGVSNALLEAMALGLPCIATDIAGNNEIIRNNENGLLVQSDDENDLAGAIVALATDQELRARLGRAAVRTVEEEYALGSVAGRWMALYSDLLQGDTCALHSWTKIAGYEGPGR